MEEKNYKYQYSDVVTNKENEIIEDNNIHNEKYNFCKYLIYTISFGKVYNNLNTYEDFMKRIISIQNLFENYLNIDHLIKIENTKDKWQNKYIFHFLYN